MIIPSWQDVSLFLTLSRLQFSALQWHWREAGTKLLSFAVMVWMPPVPSGPSVTSPMNSLSPRLLMDKTQVRIFTSEDYDPIKWKHVWEAQSLDTENSGIIIMISLSLLSRQLVITLNSWRSKLWPCDNDKINWMMSNHIVIDIHIEHET